MVLDSAGVEVGGGVGKRFWIIGEESRLLEELGKDAAAEADDTAGSWG